MDNRAKFIVALTIIGGLCCLPLLAGDREGGDQRKGGEVKRDGGEVRKEGVRKDGEVRKEGVRREGEVRKDGGGNLAAAQEGVLRGEVAQLKARVNQLEGEVRQIKALLARQGVKLNAGGEDVGGDKPAAGDGGGEKIRGDGGDKEHADKGGDRDGEGRKDGVDDRPRGGKEGEGDRKPAPDKEDFRVPPL